MNQPPAGCAATSFRLGSIFLGMLVIAWLLNRLLSLVS